MSQFMFLPFLSFKKIKVTPRKIAEFLRSLSYSNFPMEDQAGILPSINRRQAANRPVS